MKHKTAAKNGWEGEPPNPVRDLPEDGFNTVQYPRDTIDGNSSGFYPINPVHSMSETILTGG